MKKRKYKILLMFFGTTLLFLTMLYGTYSLEEENLLSKLDIKIDTEKNLTTTTMPEINDFLKNPYKGYSSEDAYIQTTGAINWEDNVDKYATEGYLRLNWYMFYKDSFIGPRNANDYNDTAYDWSTLYNLIKLYADHDMKLRFGVMTANTTSVDAAVNQYYTNSGNISSWSSNALIDLKMPKGSIIPQADYIPVISLENNKVKLTCGDVDCSKFDNSNYDNYTHTDYVVSDTDVIYKARNVTPMWMFKGIPTGYNESGEPIYSENAVQWYLDIKNVQWLPKWDDPNLINNINDFVNAMSEYLKNEEYNGKKLIDYISSVEVRSYGNYGENHIDETSLNSVDNEFRTPLLCGYLNTSLHNYAYAYERDTGFVYPNECYFNFNNENTKIYNGMPWHLSYTDTTKYYVNVSFEYYYEKYLKTYIDAFKDTGVRLVFNWFSSWDSDYYYDKNFVSNNTIKNLLEKNKGYLTIRVDSIFGSNFGEGYQLSQANGIAPTAFEYAVAGYQKYYDKEDYFSLLKDKITKNNLCSSKYDCLTQYFVNAVENSRATYMDYNYILYDYYENYINNVENDYSLDLDYLGNSLGYHFVMKQASYNTKVSLDSKNKNEKNLNVNLKIVNDGVTYLYDNNDTKAYLALLKVDENNNVIMDNENNSVVVSKYLTDIDPTTWKSSIDITGNRDSEDTSNFITENIDINISDLDDGKYILAFGIFTSFNDKHPTIKLGNEGGTNDNWYVLGNVEIENIKYNISYNGNGGLGEMNISTGTYNEKITLEKNCFEKDGYIFLNWNTSPDGNGISYNDEEEIILTDNITLYAQWQEKEPYKIKNYTVDETNKYISNIMTNTIVDSFISNIELSSGYSIDVDYKEVNNEKMIYTTGKTRIYKGNELYIEYTNIVIGDINGDGLINSTDLLRVRQHLLGKKVLDGAYFLASDINYDNTINSTDLLRIRQHLLGKKEIK